MFAFLKEKKADIFFIVLFVLLFICSTHLMPYTAISFSKATGVTVKADILLAAVITTGLLKGKKYASYFADILQALPQGLFPTEIPFLLSSFPQCLCG